LTCRSFRLASAATREPFTFFLFAAALFLAYTSVSLWVLRRLSARYSLGAKRGEV
jgi:arginine/ornithine transport system permease protein